MAFEILITRGVAEISAADTSGCQPLRIHRVHLTEAHGGRLLRIVDQRLYIKLHTMQATSLIPSTLQQHRSLPNANHIFGLDGTQDIQPTIPDPVDDACVSAKSTPIVRFAPIPKVQESLGLHTLPQKDKMKSGDVSASHGTFRNPFDKSDDEDLDAETDSSSGCDYLRPNAFSQHRDTLARIPGRHEVESDEASSSRSSIASGRSSPAVVLGAFVGHRDTFARIHFQKRVKPYIPAPIVDRLVAWLPFQDYMNLRLVCRQ